VRAQGAVGATSRLGNRRLTHELNVNDLDPAVPSPHTTPLADRGRSARWCAGCQASAQSRPRKRLGPDNQRTTVVDNLRPATEPPKSIISIEASGTTSEGIHLVAMAGIVDLMQRCFNGLETRANRLQPLPPLAGNPWRAGITDSLPGSAPTPSGQWKGRDHRCGCHADPSLANHR
jgi:hypothetical protein